MELPEAVSGVRHGRALTLPPLRLLSQALGPRPPAALSGSCLGCSASLLAGRTDGHFFTRALQAPNPLLTELKTHTATTTCSARHHPATRLPLPEREETGQAPPLGTLTDSQVTARLALCLPVTSTPHLVLRLGHRVPQGLLQADPGRRGDSAGSKLHAPPHRSGSLGSRSPRGGGGEGTMGPAGTRGGLRPQRPGPSHFMAFLWLHVGPRHRYQG